MMMLRLIRISFLLNMRDKRVIVFMLILPIALTFILGTALGPMFDNHATGAITPTNWLYQIEDSNAGDALRAFLDEHNEMLNINLIHAGDYYAALDAVSLLNVDAFLRMQGGVISIYQNQHSPDAVWWLEIVLENYVKRTAIISGIFDVPVIDMHFLELLMLVNEHATELGERVATMQVEAVRTPNAVGYYGIAMMTLISCYTLVVMILTLSKEKRLLTARRYMLSGNGLGAFLFSKSMGALVILFFQLILIMLFNTYIYGVYYGGLSTWLLVLAVTTAFTFAFTQLGTLLCLIFKNLTALVVAINVLFLPAMLFFGGAYLTYTHLYAIGLGDIVVFSPVYHINRGLFEAIYLDSTAYAVTFMWITLICGVVLMGLNFLTAKWRGDSWIL